MLHRDLIFFLRVHLASSRIPSLFFIARCITSLKGAPGSRVESDFPYLNEKKCKRRTLNKYSYFFHFSCIGKRRNLLRGENENIFHKKECLSNVP